jgi:hypothetical protein
MDKSLHDISCNPQNTIKIFKAWHRLYPEHEHVGVFITDSLLDERVVGCCMYHYRVYVKCGSSAGSLARSKGRWSALESRGASERARESLLLLAAHYCLVVTLKNYQSRLSPTWETKHVAATANLQAAKLQTTQEGLHAARFALMFIERTAAAAAVLRRLRFDNPRILLRCARVERL